MCQWWRPDRFHQQQTGTGPADAFQYIRHISDSLLYNNRGNVASRDIKTDNVPTHQGMPEICDFTQGLLYSLTEKIQDVYPMEVGSQFHLYLGGLSTTISRRTDIAHFKWPITDDKGQVREHY